MYIETIDLLRCPVEHEETWLVASFSKMQDRFVIEGKLGCPVCNAEYELRHGVAEFGSALAEAVPVEVEDDAVIRTAALLNLSRPGSLAVLCGDEARVANRVSEMTMSRVIALNPASPVEETELVSIITCDARIPLASASVDAIAIGEHAGLLTDAGRVLKPSSRIVVGREVQLRGEFTILAQDDLNTVGELNGPVVQLGRRRL